jgi:hypothetical protein
MEFGRIRKGHGPADERTLEGMSAIFRIVYENENHNVGEIPESKPGETRSLYSWKDDVAIP